jgi:cell division septum initiation protein DivIVA
VASTGTRTPRHVSIAVAASWLLLLGCGAVEAGAASGEPPPSLEKLWGEYPLGPTATTPTQPSPAARPPARSPAPASTAPAAERGRSPLLIGGAAAVVLALAAALVLVLAKRRRRPVPPPEGRMSTEDLIARAFALAAECDMLLANQRKEGAPAVSETADHDLPPSPTQPAPPAAGFTEIGERVAGVLRAAETAAEQIRTDAQAQADDLLRGAHAEAERVRNQARTYENDTRDAVDAYATEQRRIAEEQIGAQLSDAEAQARATREAAEEMARRIEEDARLRGQTLREESRAVEERLKKVQAGMRRMAAQLEELLGTPAAAQTDGDLVEALKPYAHREAELEPLAEDS